MRSVIIVENANEMQKLCEQFIGTFDTPKSSKLAKFYILKLMFK